MINFSLHGLGVLCSQLMLEEIMRSEHIVASDSVDDPADEAGIERIKKWLKLATDIAAELECKAVQDRVEIFERRLTRTTISNRDIGTEVRVLKETLISGTKDQFVYRYPEEKSRVLKRWKDDWKLAINAFPSAEQDIKVAADLWALGHGTASVYYFMRVLEHGLRALATDVGRSFDLQNWHNIIDEIQSSITELSKSLPKGAARNDRLEFLSLAATEFRYFKDGWRNHVAHGRATYDEHQARSVMEHVRTFMNVLSDRLSE